MNHEMIVLWSDNERLVAEIAGDYLEPENYGLERDDGETRLCMLVNEPLLPSKAVDKLSALHPETACMASYDFGDEAAQQKRVEKFKAGEGPLVEVQMKYFWLASEDTHDGHELAPGQMELPDEKTVAQLKRNITEVFRRIDAAGEGQKMHVMVYEPAVTVTAYHDGWKMTATKNGSIIRDIKISRKMVARERFHLSVEAVPHSK